MDSVSVVFEDHRLLVVDKLPNIPFHSDDEQQGIVNRVREQFGANNLYPVHRLDKITSGLLVFAKNDAYNRLISSLFQNRQIEKYYIGISDKRPNKKQGTIKGDMEKARGGAYKLTRNTSNPAITRFVSANCASKSGDRVLTVFLFKPETGKTHQLRVAAKSLGSPLVGDGRYTGTDSDRGYLHAYRLRFILEEELVDLVCEPREGALFTAPEVKKAISSVESKIDAGDIKWPKGSFLVGGD